MSIVPACISARYCSRTPASSSRVTSHAVRQDLGVDLGHHLTDSEMDRRSRSPPRSGTGVGRCEPPAHTAAPASSRQSDHADSADQPSAARGQRAHALLVAHPTTVAIFAARRDAGVRRVRPSGRSAAASWPQAPSISRPRVSRIGGRDAARPQRRDERPLDLRSLARPLRAGRRVQRDRVDVHPAPAPGVEQLAEQVGAPGVVVDVADERVLDGDPPAGGLRVLAARRRAPRPPSTGCSPAPAVAQLVVGRVQAQRERHRDALPGQAAHRRHQARRSRR